MTAFRMLSLAVVLAGAAAKAGAQGSCAINTGGSPELNGARQYWTKASSATGSADEKPKHLANGVRVLTTPKALGDKNQLGRTWLLSRILYQWMQQPKQPMVTTRAQLGFSDNPSQSVDLLAVMDTTLAAVEAANPACRDSTNMFRKNLFNASFAKGVEALNADQVDSATILVRRALIIDPRNVNGYNALAVIAQRKDDQAGMLENYSKVIEYAGTDTAHAKTVDLAVQNLAILKINQAEKLEGEARTRTLREAETMFRSYLAKKPGDANAQQGLARVLGVLGDTAAIQKIYQDMLSNRANYTDIQFFEAGSGAANGGQRDLAIKLTDAGLEKNPYFRDGLYNVATLHFEAQDAKALEPAVLRLLAVDPNNTSNWRLLAGLYQLRNEAAKKAGQKQGDKKLIDSLLYYMEYSAKLPVEVEVRQFVHSGAKHTLQLSVANRGKAATKQEISVDFLNAKGEVVAQKRAPVSLDAGQSTEVNVEAVQSGVSAYRYKVTAQ